MRRTEMRSATRTMLWALLVVLCVMAQPTAGQRNGAAHSASDAGVQVDKNSVGGVVLNSNGAKLEAGVWVIAETKSLPVPFRKIVVTDDQGRFLVPDLPDGAYELWVRGYGLKDSERVSAARGAKVKLQVANAATPQEAAKIYPASYWTSMIHPPAKQDLPAGYATQEQWLAALRGGCNQCHQLGMLATGRHTDLADWDGIFQRNQGMGQAAGRLGKDLLEKTLVDWELRMKAGEVPPSPPGPTGIKTNFWASQANG